MTFHPIDVHVGSEIRRRRHLHGISQQGLAKALGITFQQVQKYERGANRISASRLYEAAGVLHCLPGDLFPGEDRLRHERMKARIMDAADSLAGVTQALNLLRQEIGQ